MKGFEHTSKKKSKSDGRKLVGEDILILEDLFDKALQVCGITHARFVNLSNDELTVLQDGVSRYIEKECFSTRDNYHIKYDDQGRLYKRYQANLRETLYNADEAKTTSRGSELKKSDRVSDFLNCKLPWSRALANSLAYYASRGEFEYWSLYRSDVIKGHQSIGAENKKATDPDELNQALSKWKEIVLSEPYWNPVQLVFPNNFSSTEFYQKIDIVPFRVDDEILLAANPSASEFEFSVRQFDTVRLTYPLDYLLNLRGDCHALVGIPGSGKTSSLKWLLRQTALGEQSHFKHALYISLRGLSSYLMENPGGTIYEFFFITYINTNEVLAKELGTRLEKVSRLDVTHSLFLLDALDEVSSFERRTLVQRLSKDLQGITCILTTRPTAAYLLNLSSNIKLYEIAPLRKNAVKALVSEFCKYSSKGISADDLLIKLSHNLTFHKLNTSTFLLVILCEIITNDKGFKELKGLTTSSIFSILVKIVQLEHNNNHDEIIDERHIELLTEFADMLSCSSKEKLLSGRFPSDSVSIEPLVQSRFINEILFHPGVFEFIHLRFQEYFTAKAVLGREKESLEMFLQDKAFDFEWLEIVCLLSGLTIGTGFDEKFNKIISEKFLQAEKELTKHAALMLTKILVAKKASLRIEYGNTIPYDFGINMVINDHPLAKEFVMILLEVHPFELLEALKNLEVPRHIWEFIYYSTPFYIKEYVGLNSKSPVKNYPSIIFSPDPGFIPDELISIYREKLTNWKQEDGNLVIFSMAYAGRCQDAESVSVLGEILNDGPHHLKNTAILTLARIGTSEAMHLLVDKIIECHKDHEFMTSMASTLNRHAISSINAREKLSNWFAESQDLSPQTISCLLKIFTNFSIDISTSRKVTNLYILRRNLFQNELVFIFFGKVVDGYSLNLLLNHALSNDSAEALTLIRSIPYIPSGSFGMLKTVFDKADESDNREERLTYLSLLAKTYTKYPDYKLIKTVPGLLLKQLENPLDDAFACTILYTARYCKNEDVLITKAWNIVASKDANISLRSMAIMYLESCFINIDEDQVDQLMVMLIEEQKDKSRFKFVKKVLAFMITTSQNQSKKILSIVNESFNQGNRQGFSGHVVNCAIKGRELIFQ